MKALIICPEDIGAHSEYSDDWIKFITKLGYTGGNVWNYAVVVPIDVNL